MALVTDWMRMGSGGVRGRRTKYNKRGKHGGLVGKAKPKMTYILVVCHDRASSTFLCFFSSFEQSSATSMLDGKWVGFVLQRKLKKKKKRIGHVQISSTNTNE